MIPCHQSRRRFLRTAAWTAAGAFLIPACANDDPETATLNNTISKTSDMSTWPTGIQLYTVRESLAKDLEETIEKVAEIGYDQVELFGYSSGRYFDRPAVAFYQILRDQGLDITSSHHLSGRTDTAAKGTLTNGWEQAIEDAVSAGQSFMVLAWLHPEERQSLDDYKSLADLLNQAGEACAQAGLQLCYHNHDFEFQLMEGKVPMFTLLDSTDPNLVKMELDLYWVTKAGYKAQDFFSRYPGRTALWHVKDMDDTSEQRFTEVGTGVIDFPAIFAEAEKSGVQAFFVEHDQPTDPLASIATSYTNVQKILKG